MQIDMIQFCDEFFYAQGLELNIFAIAAKKTEQIYIWMLLYAGNDLCRNYISNVNASHKHHYKNIALNY